MDVQTQDAVPAWQRAVAQGDVGLWDLRPEHETVQYSPAWKLRLGFPEPHRADSTHFWRCRVHPLDLDAMLVAMRDHSRGLLPTYEAQFRLRSNGSGYRLLRSRGRVLERNAEGRVLRMVGVMVDLTDRPCTPAPGLPQGERGVMAGVPLGLPLHELLLDARPEPAVQAVRARVLAVLDDLLHAALHDLPPPPGV